MSVCSVDWIGTEIGACNNQISLIIIGPFDFDSSRVKDNPCLYNEHNQDSTVSSLFLIKFQSPESSPFTDKLPDNLVREETVVDEIFIKG